MSKLFNPMSIEDVRVDTHYHVSRMAVSRGAGRNRKRVQLAIVIALKRCGCEGPVLGTLEQVELAKVGGARITVPERPNSTAKLWGIRPEGRTSRAAPLEYVWGQESAAERLRDYWAHRNLKRVLTRAERRAAA